MARVKFANFNLIETSWTKFSGFSRPFCSDLVEFSVLWATKSNSGSVFSRFSGSARHPAYLTSLIFFPGLKK